LEDVNYAASLKNLKRLTVKDVLRDDYRKKKYRNEANESQLNDTPSREKIVEENDHVVNYATKEYIEVFKTITTKQDRNPNSGVVPYEYPREGKLNFRYLTARECFVAMGFDEEDFDLLMDNNITIGKNRPMFSMGKLIKMAGNSIVVNVLEAIFAQVDFINNHII
jgi:DNA (cytosine-5)-methyltransferase 1